MTERLTKEAARVLSESLGEPGWLAERRSAAFDLFEKLELPNPKGEEWRYTDVRGFDFSEFEAPVAASNAPEIPEDLAAKGVIVCDWAEAIRNHEGLLKEHFFTDVPVDEHKFTALHGAFVSDGLLVYVPRGVEVAAPIEALRAPVSGNSTIPHTTIVLDEQAHLTFVDLFRSETKEAPALCSSVVEITAGPGSTVNYISLQQWGRHVS